MDDDLRAALFDEADEEGTFEELDDDFILQVNLADRYCSLFQLLHCTTIDQR